jgi:hypothetical protein
VPDQAGLYKRVQLRRRNAGAWKKNRLVAKGIESFHQDVSHLLSPKGGLPMMKHCTRQAAAAAHRQWSYFPVASVRTAPSSLRPHRGLPLLDAHFPIN